LKSNRLRKVGVRADLPLELARITVAAFGFFLQAAVILLSPVAKLERQPC
jgi:hypothetical protein